VNLANTYLRHDSLAAAERELRRAIELDPDVVSARVNLAYIFDATLRPEETLRMLREAVALDNTAAQAQYMLGVVAMRRKFRDEAIQSLVNALALAPAAPFADDARQRLAALLGQDQRLPRPSIKPPRRKATAPAAVRLNPKATWPIRSWPDFTPRTTPEEVLALAPPSDLAAALDSAEAWIQRADQRFLSMDTRRAYAERALSVLEAWGRARPSDPCRAADILRLKGHGYAVLSSLAPRSEKESLATLGQRLLDGVDTLACADAAAKRRLGQAYYRLARAYNEEKAYEKAATAFTRAARLVPNSFTEAISYFFIGTSYDRLGERDKAKAAYAISAANPHNSVRGVRCSRHALVYPFQYRPE